MVRSSLRVGILCLATSVLLFSAVRAEDPLPNVETVRELLMPGAGGLIVVNEETGQPIHPHRLLKFGDRLFPTYETIIADPKSDRAVVANALSYVGDIKGDRRRFITLAVNRLTDSRFGVRGAAVRLLGNIGSERDTAPIVALLSDEDSGVRRDAARTLAKIGGNHEVVALDIWLKNGNHRNDGDHVRLVKQARDELEKRLKEHPIPKDLKD